MSSAPRLIKIPASAVADPVASAASARIASSILVFAVLTVVVVPLTVRLPDTVKSMKRHRRVPPR